MLRAIHGCIDTQRNEYITIVVSIRLGRQPVGDPAGVNQDVAL
jgi:hypothetical protein